MRIWRGLRTRIIIGSILCGILGLVVSWTVIRYTAREALRTGFAPYVRRSLDGEEVRRCELAPERWSLQLQRAHIDAYDENTLSSRNPDAPPLDESLYHRLQNGETSPSKFFRFEGEEAMVLRIGSSGPCGLVQVTWPRRAWPRRVIYLMLIGTLLVIAAAAALGVFFVVQPLTKRIAKLRTAAGAIGSHEGYSPSTDPGTDELGELSSGLDRAHARIRADADRLEERQRALERYLADIAHDLKTPIASLHIALEQAANLSRDSELSGLLKSSLKDVIYIDGLTANLRLACQLRDGWSPADGNPSVDLTDTVERVVARARYFAKNRGITLDAARPDARVLGRCHPTAAEQAITNMVENAIAYGDPGGHVAVVLESDETSFSLVVVDDGPGYFRRSFRASEKERSDRTKLGSEIHRVADSASRSPARFANVVDGRSRSNVRSRAA